MSGIIVYLDVVTNADADYARKHGAKFDLVSKRWFIRDLREITVWNKLIPERYKRLLEQSNTEFYQNNRKLEIKRLRDSKKNNVDRNRIGNSNTENVRSSKLHPLQGKKSQSLSIMIYGYRDNRTSKYYWSFIRSDAVYNSGWMIDSDNGTMELIALSQALNSLEDEYSVKIYSNTWNTINLIRKIIKSIRKTGSFSTKYEKHRELIGRICNTMIDRKVSIEYAYEGKCKEFDRIRKTYSLEDNLTFDKRVAVPVEINNSIYDGNTK